MVSDGEWGVGGEDVQMVKPAENCQMYSSVLLISYMLKILFIRDLTCLLLIIWGAGNNLRIVSFSVSVETSGLNVVSA